MTRPFYDCPLKAAFMAKTYGVAFTLPEHCPHPWNQPGHRVTWAALADMHCGDFSIWNADGSGICSLRWCEQMKPLYVHADSLHLLDVRVGDLISINGGQTASVATSPAFLGELRRWEPMFADPLRIIEREGKPFFWPESEP